MKIRQLLLILFLMSSTTAFSQNVEKVVFERAVDYINCQITKVSLEDQVGQAHLADYKKEVGSQNCEFENLVEFLKTRSTGVMIKNLELSFFINSYKEKYQEGLTNAELYTLLQTNLLKEAPIQNFKIKHEKSFPVFESGLNDYLVRLFKLNETVTETIEDGMGDVVMVIEGEEYEPTKPNISNESEDVNLPEKKPNEETVNTNDDSRRYIQQNDYSPFDFEESEEVFAWSSWLFRFSLLFVSLAILLYVLLPYYEKREKAKVKQPGGEVHPEALSLQAEIAIMENNNRILKQKIRTMHLDLNEYEDTFRSLD